MYLTWKFNMREGGNCSNPLKDVPDFTIAATTATTTFTTTTTTAVSTNITISFFYLLLQLFLLPVK